MKAHTQRLGKEMLAQVAGIFATLCDRILVAAIVVRMWGETGFAHWTLIMSAAGLFGLFDFGLNYYFSNRLSMLVAKRRMMKALHAFRSGTIMVSAAAIFGVGAIIFGFSLYTAHTAPVPRDVWYGLFGVLAGTAMHYLVALYYFLFRAHDQFATQSILQAVRDLARVAFPVSAIMLGADMAQAGLAYFAGSFLTTLPLLVGLARKRFPQFVLRWEWPNRAERHNARTVGLSYWIQSMATTLVTFLPIFLIYGTASHSAVAQFALVRTLANFARMAQQLVGLVLGQEAARLWVRGEGDAVVPLFLRGTALIGVTSACGSAAILALGRPLFHLWTGETDLFDPALLVVALIPLTLAPTLLFTSSFFLSANRPAPLVEGRISQVVLSIAGYLLLPIDSAPLRMMCALTLAELIGFGLPLIIHMKRVLPAIGWATHASVTARTTAAAVLSYGAAVAASLALPPGIVSFLGAGAACLVAGLAAFALLALQPSDRSRALAILRARFPSHRIH